MASPGATPRPRGPRRPRRAGRPAGRSAGRGARRGAGCDPATTGHPAPAARACAEMRPGSNARAPSSAYDRMARRTSSSKSRVVCRSLTVQLLAQLREDAGDPGAGPGCRSSPGRSDLERVEADDVAHRQQLPVLGLQVGEGIHQVEPADAGGGIARGIRPRARRRSPRRIAVAGDASAGALRWRRSRRATSGCGPAHGGVRASARRSARRAGPRPTQRRRHP